jgi:N-acetylglucosaminyl-diphospho-decaprenol L-rhamnosyltransferase
MTAERNPVTIALVTYNSRDHIADCVKWFADRPAAVRVRIRDNGSTDATPKVLQRLAEEGLIDELVLSEDDPGFAIAANDLIRRSGSDDIILMNPDARIALDTIEFMRDTIATDLALGAVSPVVSSGDDISVMTAGRQPRLWPMITHYSGLSRLFPKSKVLKGRHLFLKHHSHQDQLVEWTSGCCLYIPRRTIDRVGLLSERWFLYGEDTEYCKRIGDAGLLIKVLSSARAFHENGTSAVAEVAKIDEGVTADGADEGAVWPAVTAPAPDVSRMWGRSLYDYYTTAYTPNAMTRLAWKVTFTSGNVARATVRRWRNPQDRTADRLMKNGLAVWQ